MLQAPGEDPVAVTAVTDTSRRLGERAANMASVAFDGMLEPSQILVSGFIATIWIAAFIAFVADTLLFYQAQGSLEHAFEASHTKEHGQRVGNIRIFRSMEKIA